MARSISEPTTTSNTESNGKDNDSMSNKKTILRADGRTDEELEEDEGKKEREAGGGGGGGDGDEATEEVLEEDENQGVPTDTGWSWVVVVAVLLNSFVTLGHRKCQQALFVDITEEFQASTAVAALTFTCQNFVSSFSSLFTTNVLMSRFHARTLCAGFALMNGILTMFTFWAPGITVWLIIYGLKGFSFGALIVLPVSQIGHYFKKRRALASSISTLGLVLSNIVFPPLAVYLKQEFGFRWTFLILGAIELNAIAPLMLLRPPSSYINVYKRNQATRLQNLPSTTSTSVTNDVTNNGTTHSKTSPPTPTVTGNKDQSSTALLSEKYLTPHKTKELSDKNYDTVYSRKPRTFSENSESVYSLTGSTVDIGASAWVAIEETKESDSVGKNKKRLCFLWILFDTSMLKLWTCRMMMSYYSFSAFSIFLLQYMPTVAFRAGISKVDAALLLTIAGCTDLVVRIIVGFIADKGFISKERMAAGALIIVGILSHLSRFYTTYTLFVIFAILVGIFTGVRQCLLNSMCLDLFGAVRTAKALGLITMSVTLMMSINHPVVGALADATGSFTVSLHYVGSMVFIAVIIISLSPIFKRWDEENRRKKEAKGDKEDGEKEEARRLTISVEKSQDKRAL